MITQKEEHMVRDAHFPAPSIKTPDELVDMLKKNVGDFNLWREANPDVIITMHGANFYKCDLRGANLRGTILEKADFSFARLNFADLTNAKLDGAIFVNADLWHITADALTRDVITTKVMLRLYEMKASWQ